MPDRISTYVLGLDGDDLALRNIFAGLKSRVKSDVQELEAIAGKLDLFGQISDNLPKVTAAIDKAKAQIATLTAEVDKFKAAGETAPKQLTDALAAAEKAAKTATTEFNRQSQQLAALQTSLSKAGVETKNFAAEQTRLTAASKAAADAATLLAAKQTLGLTTLKDIQPEIAKLNAAYTTLQKSGTLSASETAAAQSLLLAKTKDLTGTVSTLGRDATTSGTSLVSMFTRAVLPALGLTGGIAGVVAILKSAIAAANEFELNVVRIGTVTTLSKDQLGALGDSAKALARELHITSDEALKGLYELLRSGVPPENSLEVLRIAAIAAKAAMEDTSVGVKAANVLLSGFKIPAGEVGDALDKIAVAAKNGGPTLKEFADNAGALGPVASAAKIPFDELISIFAVMTNATGDAALSATTLQQIIKKYDTAEAREKLHGLTIETGDLVKTFQQLAEKKLPINDVLELGLAGTKAAAGLLALTQNADALGPAMDRSARATGENQKVADQFANTAKGRSDKVTAEFDQFEISVGKAFGSGSRFQGVLADMLGGFNALPAEIKTTAIETGNFNFILGSMLTGMLGIAPATAKATEAFKQMGDAGEETSKKVVQVSRDVDKANQDLALSAKNLLVQIEALQSVAARDIADINARADAQIAALDRSKAAEKETADATLAIRTKQSEDILKVLTDSEASITAAVKKEIEARTALAGKDAESQRRLTAETTKLELDAIDKLRASYELQYKFLIGKEQEYAAAAEKSARDRLAFNEAIEKTLFDIRVAGLSSFDQFVAKSQEADRLISASRQAAEKGDADAAQKFGNQAIAIANSLGVAYSVNGAQIISTSQAADEKLRIIKGTQDAVNLAFTNQGAAAKKGADATKEQLLIVEGKLKDLQGKYDKLKETVETALKISIDKDIAGIDDAEKKLNYVSRDRDVTFKVRLDIDEAGNVLESVTVPAIVIGGVPYYSGGASGGYVDKAGVQGFAAGGPVFAHPAWSKVPGIGNTDSVPAMLQVGSFVMRKAASEKYGDGLMAMLARGFASGGGVGIGSLFGAFRNNVQLAGGGGNFQYPDPRWVDNWAREIPSGASDGEKLQAIKGEADGFFAKLLEWGFGLPHSPFGDLSDYIRNAHKRLNNTSDPETAFAILQNMKAQSDTFITTFRGARVFHAPAVQPVNAVGLDDLASIDYLNSVPFGSLSKAEQERLKAEKERLALRKKQYGFAGGGSVGTDVLPAMLTPGEWVIPKHVAAMLGGGFLNALNQGRVPAPAFKNLAFAPPQMPRYAMGGPVGGVSIPERGSAWPGGAGGALIGSLTINGANINWEDPQQVERVLRRGINPALREIQRRTGKP